MASGEQTPFQEILDHDPFCQGDILHCDCPDNEGLGSFATIITADCDIAQGKDGGEFSVLRIIPAERYVRHVWAPVETRKLVTRQMISVLGTLNAAISRKDERLDRLTPIALQTWLASGQPEDILDAVDVRAKSAREDANRALYCIRDSLPAQADEAPIAALKRVWSRLGTPEKTILSRLSDVLDPARGAADMHFIPYMPGFAEIGFVIQLRALAALPRQDVYPSKLDARVEGHHDCFYRVGRFRDGIKYSIVQRMVNLFSRVGLSEEYESESSFAADIVVEAINEHIRGLL